MRITLILFVFISANLFSQDNLHQAFTYSEMLSDCQINHRTIEKIKVRGDNVENDFKKIQHQNRKELWEIWNEEIQIK